ncbi:MAG: single-stranded DNA-binding protein [Clostridiales bacterium]|nr:single-stranded DNA-binding protein [Clostridiales bacterium]
MNKVFLIGNLTKDPDVRTTGGGTSVCTFTVAVDRRFKAQNGEKVTDFFTIVAWRQLADLCGRYLAKGRKVSVVGELQNRSYDAKDGSKRYVTEIVADEIEFLTPRDSRDSASYGVPASSDAYRAPAAPMAPEGFTDVDDDDLPF